MSDEVMLEVVRDGPGRGVEARSSDEHTPEAALPRQVCRAQVRAFISRPVLHRVMMD